MANWTPIHFGYLAIPAVVAGCQPGQQAPEATSKPEVGASADVDPSQRVVYIPAYSHITSREGTRNMLGVTLSVRNVDHAATVTLTAVDYFNTEGRQVRRYLEGPVQLKPLATAEYIVDALDDTGGSGANFLVQWSGPPHAHPLLTETVMIGHAGQGYLSFTSRGVELSAAPSEVSQSE